MTCEAKNCRTEEEVIIRDIPLCDKHWDQYCNGKKVKLRYNNSIQEGQNEKMQP